MEQKSNYIGPTLQLGKKKEPKIRGTAIFSSPISVEERLTSLEDRLAIITKVFYSVKNVPNDENNKDNYNAYDDKDNLNKDGIPINDVLIGTTRNVPDKTFVITVDRNGYWLGNTKYESLSSAAEAASGVRRSGWTFWKIPGSNKTVKEMFKKLNG